MILATMSLPDLERMSAELRDEITAHEQRGDLREAAKINRARLDVIRAINDRHEAAVAHIPHSRAILMGQEAP